MFSQTKLVNLSLFVPLLLAGASGEVHKEILKIDGRQHVYFVFVPSAAPSPSGAPLLMLLHGSGHDGMSLIGPWKELAAKECIILVAPSSMVPAQWQAPLDGPEPLIAIGDTVRQKYSADPKRVYLFGHSAGAGFSLLLALAKQDYFAAIAAHAGALDAKAEPLVSQVTRRTPIQMQVGTRDPLFPLVNVRHTRDVFVAAGFPFDLEEIPQHDHNYYGISDQVNRAAWNFLKDKRLP
jgi:poly(3-hydroxybutyrate) depolymerase